MKTLLLAGAGLALLATVSLSPAMAQGRNSPAEAVGIPQRVGPNVSTGVAAAPRYELQYGYDKHARWRGHWVLVR
jgi:hypothetical protein